MEHFNKLKQLIANAEADALKVETKATSAASVRLRKRMMEIKEVAQDVRLWAHAKTAKQEMSDTAANVGRELLGGPGAPPTLDGVGDE